MTVSLVIEIFLLIGILFWFAMERVLFHAALANSVSGFHPQNFCYQKQKERSAPTNSCQLTGGAFSSL
jgi:hypothetical protein